MSLINAGRSLAHSIGLPPVTKAGRFLRAFNANLAGYDWEPHPLYSVFTQFDQSHYLAHREAFVHKYKCFWAVSRTISPRSIIEIGPHAGSSADAYLSATPSAEYLGVDKFCNDQEIYHEVTGERWLPIPRLHKLFAERGFTNYELLEVNLRDITELPRSAEMVVVDAAHDFFNEYEDLKLALSAHPRWVWIDDYGMDVVGAVEKWLRDDVRGRVVFTHHVPYYGGGGSSSGPNPNPSILVVLVLPRHAIVGGGEQVLDPRAVAAEVAQRDGIARGYVVGRPRAVGLRGKSPSLDGSGSRR